jgi:hypothetical protein
MSDIVHEEIAKDDGKPNGGFKYGLQFPTADHYYGADAVRRTNAGLLEWYTVFPTYNRIARQCEDGTILFDFAPSVTLEQFKSLSGGCPE